MAHLRRRLAIIALAILATLVFGTAGFVLIDQYPLFDAFYMTLITVTTVGYSEILPLSHAGRVFNSFLIFFGVSVMLLAFGAMTQTVIELEFNQYFGKRRVRGMIDKLENHFIVCGYGRVGRGAAEELHVAGVPFVVIDRSEERVERAMKAGMLAVVGDATHDDVLREVGIAKAKGLIATLASDADNLFVILSAKALNARLHLSARIDEEASEQKMRRAGADFVFAPYKSTGHRMAQALLKPHVHQFMDFTRHGVGPDVGIEQVRVSTRSSFADQTLGRMEVQRSLGLMVLAVRKADGQMLFNPTPDQKIAAGDHLIVMGESDRLRKLEHMLAGTPA
ncbi:MAG TPA: NAD-binding protein [Bryobacteraceae bacterium]|nr:NAD-binding protein [Bryobacteraceae bacterium]